jgi:hypothetical protein
VDVFARNPLSQHHEGITDLLIGTSDSDVALVTRTFHQGVGGDSSAGNVVDLFKAFPPLPDNVRGRCIRDGHGNEVTVGFTLLREGLSEVEGEGIRRDRFLLGRFFFLSRLGF